MNKAFALILILASLTISCPFLEHALANTFPSGYIGVPQIILENNSVTPPNVPVEFQNGQYRLTGNISNYTIIVLQEKVVLDGNGFCLQGEMIADGITIMAANYVTVKNFNIESFAVGIRVLGSTNCTITNNCINDCGRGIEINSNPFYKYHDYVQIAATNNCLMGNEITNCTSGIGIFTGSRFNLITKNFVIGSSNRGIYLSSDSNSVTLNIISENDKGIVADHCTDNTVRENIIESNREAIVLTNLGGGATNNLFYLNNFIDNNELAVPPDNCLNRVITPNLWDNGSVGNYWGDYNGQKVYEINENNIDHYPLTEKAAIPLILPPSFTSSPSFTSPDLSLLVIISLLFCLFPIAIFICRRKIRK